MQHKYLWVLLFVAILFSSFFWSAGGSRILDEAPYYYKKLIGQTGQVVVGNQTIDVEIASTPSARAKGLLGREYLAEKHGMLFVFPDADEYVFTMKGMSINIDIVWILNGRITHIAPNTQPDQPDINPGVPANFVLEVRPGTAAGWQVGDDMEINFDTKK